MRCDSIVHTCTRAHDSPFGDEGNMRLRDGMVVLFHTCRLQALVPTSRRAFLLATFSDVPYCRNHAMRPSHAHEKTKSCRHPQTKPGAYKHTCPDENKFSSRFPATRVHAYTGHVRIGMRLCRNCVYGRACTYVCTCKIRKIYAHPCLCTSVRAPLQSANKGFNHRHCFGEWEHRHNLTVDMSAAGPYAFFVAAVTTS